MKKIYLKPAMKTQRLPELMQATVTGSELDPNSFELGAKGFDGEDEEVEEFVIKPRNVWDD